MTEARLEVIDQRGARSMPIVSERFTIGRRGDNDLQVGGFDVSRQHAEILRRDDRFVLCDLGSSFGTFVNGERIEEERPLVDGDRIRLGNSDQVRIRFLIGAGKPATATTRITTTAAYDLRPLARVLEALQAMGSGRVLEEVLSVVLDAAIDVSGAERGFVMLAVEGGELEYKLGRSRGGHPLSGEEFRISRRIPQETFRTRTTQAISDLMDPGLAGQHGQTLSFGIRFAICVPLRHVHFGNGGRDEDADRVIGVIYLDSRTPGQLLTESTRDALEALAGQAALAIENARLAQEAEEKRRQDEEMRKSIEILNGILPGPSFEAPGCVASAMTIPCRSVGGDFFDYTMLPEGDVAFVLGDVTGHGPDAALLAVRTHGIFSTVVEIERRPARVAERVNHGLNKRPLEGRFVTCYFAILDPNGLLRTCNAGHSPALLVRADGSVRTLAAGGLMLGIFPGATFEEEEIGLEPGDKLILFSDGVTECVSPDGEQFGDQRLERLVATCSSLEPGELIDRVRREIAAFAAGRPAEDDVTLLVVEYRGAPAPARA